MLSKVKNLSKYNYRSVKEPLCKVGSNLNNEGSEKFKKAWLFVEHRSMEIK